MAHGGLGDELVLAGVGSGSHEPVHATAVPEDFDSLAVLQRVHDTVGQARHHAGSVTP